MLVIGSLAIAPSLIQQLILVDGWQTTFTPASVCSAAKLNLRFASEWSPTSCMEVSSACFPKRCSAIMLSEVMCLSTFVGMRTNRDAECLCWPSSGTRRTDAYLHHHLKVPLLRSTPCSLSLTYSLVKMQSVCATNFQRPARGRGQYTVQQRSLNHPW